MSVIVLFGATGDLTKRKLIPALYKLYRSGKKYPIVCVARRNLAKKAFIQHLDFSQFLPNAKDLTGFTKYLSYVQMDLTHGDPSFGARLRDLDKKYKCKGSKLFYLAVAPHLFAPISKLLHDQQLLTGKGAQRVAFEKPFGHDFASARALNKQLAKYFKEDQVFRVDHYLAKELVEDLLVLRFSNALLRDVWNKDYVDHVQITISEQVGVEERAGYYDKSGAVRDMIQSHALQILALIASEEPKSWSANAIRDQKVKVLKSLKVRDVVLGQYRKGTVSGKSVIGYKQESSIPRSSKTETYAAVKLHVGTPRWRGVPFYIRTGKRLADRYADVHVVLKDKCGLFCDKGAQPNIIRIGIQPDQIIQLRFNEKIPGHDLNIAPVSMEFCQRCVFGINSSDAYEFLLTEILRGDQTLFTRWDGVEASWKFVESVYRKAKHPVGYAAGKHPKPALALTKWLHKKDVGPAH